MQLLRHERILAFLCALLAVAIPHQGIAAPERFVEFQKPTHTRTFDLSTVQVLQPGRFTIESVEIGTREAIDYLLAALDSVNERCSSPVGEYPAPAIPLPFGPSDAGVQPIKVSIEGSLKIASWSAPYWSLKGMTIDCTSPNGWLEARSRILNGNRWNGVRSWRKPLRAIDHSEQYLRALFGGPRLKAVETLCVLI